MAGNARSMEGKEALVDEVLNILEFRNSGLFILQFVIKKFYVKILFAFY